MFEQFKNISNNQAYKMAFADRMMLRDPANLYNIIGNTQRSDFIPYLKQIINDLGPNPRIFDVGAGNGEIVDILLSKLPSATLAVEEPNPLFRNEYIQRLKKYPHLKLDSVYDQPIQKLYGSVSESYDLILAVHMLYFLTDYRSKGVITASDDLVRFISFLYGLLPKNGKLFLAYADQRNSTTGKAAKYYYSHKNKEAYMCDNLDSIWNARERLLKECGVSSQLNSLYPDFEAKTDSVLTGSYLYGKTLEDIIVMCIAGELGSSNNNLFDEQILELCADFVNNHKIDIGLTTELRDCPQKGMLRCNQPQVICTIMKT